MLPVLAAERQGDRAPTCPARGYSDKPEREYTVRYYEDRSSGCSTPSASNGPSPSADRSAATSCSASATGSPSGSRASCCGRRAAPGRRKPRVARVLRAMPPWMFWPIVRGQSRFWFSRDFPGREARAGRDVRLLPRGDVPRLPRHVLRARGRPARHVAVPDRPRDPPADAAHVGRPTTGAAWARASPGSPTRSPTSSFVTFPGRRHSLEAEQPVALAITIKGWLGD